VPILTALSALGSLANGSAAIVKTINNARLANEDIEIWSQQGELVLLCESFPFFFEFFVLIGWVITDTLYALYALRKTWGAVLFKYP